MVQTVGQRQHAMAADPSPGRFQTRDAVGARREADRPTGVGADRAIAKPGRCGHARTTGRHAGPLLGVPGVERWRERWMVRRVSAFGHVQLAQHHRAGVEQLAHHGGIGLGHMVVAQRRAPGGTNASGLAQVLQADRHAVHRPAPLAAPDLVLGLARLRQCELGGDGEVAAQRRVQAGDARQHRLGDFNRRELSSTVGGTELGDGGKRQRVERHRETPVQDGIGLALRPSPRANSIDDSPVQQVFKLAAEVETA